VTVFETPLLLPEQTNRAINELTTLTVTNTATEILTNRVGGLLTNSLNFAYTNRAALTNDGGISLPGPLVEHPAIRR